MMLRDLIAQVRTGVIQVLLERSGRQVGSGTAFLVEGGLVTNSHVLRSYPADAIVFRTANDSQGNQTGDIRLLPSDCFAAIVAESTESERDYAFLRLDEPEFQTGYKFRFDPRSRIEPGEQILFLGFPFGMEQLTAHVGYVSSVFDKNGVRVIQIDGSINGGNSGGPVLRLDGMVVGVVTRAITGLIEDQFDKLLKALRQNQKALEGAKGLMRIDMIDPIQAVQASNAAMEEIARNLLRSANVGIGYAYSSRYVNEHIAQVRKTGVVPVGPSES